MMTSNREVYYKRLFDEAPIGIYRSLPDGKILDANLAMVRILRYPSLEDLRAVPFLDLFPDTAPSPPDNISQPIPSGTTTRELQIKVFDGSIIWVRETTHPIYDEAGNIVYLEGTLEDISAQVETALALRETRARVEAERAQRLLAETLRDVNASISASLQLDEVLERVLSNLRILIPYDGASILLRSDTHITVVAHHGPFSVTELADVRISLSEDTLARQIFETQQSVVLVDTFDEPRFARHATSSYIRSWIGIPLITRGQTFGLLTIDNSEAGCYGEREAQVASAFASQVAIAIENARLYETEHQRAVELNALRATAADITAELELSVLLQAILQRAITLIKASGGELGLYNESSNEIRITACLGMVSDFTGLRMKANRGALGHVIKTRQPLLITDYKEWSGHLPTADRWPYQGVIAVPLIVRERILGVIALVDSAIERVFNGTELQLLTHFGQQAAIAIENATLFQQTQAALANTETLYRIAQALISTESLNELLQNLVDQVAEALPADRSILIMLDPEHQEIERYIFGGPGAHIIHEPGYKELWDGLTGWVMRERRPALSLKDSIELREQAYVRQRRQTTHSGAIVVVPLLYRDQILGTLTGINRPDDRDFTERDQELMTTIASHVAIAIKNAQLFEEIQRLAETDDLTGINNRRQLFFLGQHEFIRAKRYKTPLTAIMLDLDDFKQVNDTHGHAVGDDVLRGLAQICQDKIRDTDILGRYGGEEFVIILPETHLKTAIEIAERLRLAVETTPIGTRDDALRITISVGVAETSNAIPDLATLIDRADTAMYCAKRAGRNRVEFIPNP